MSARILQPTPENIALAAQAILRGEVVGMPTETVYGLAALAFDEVALARIFLVKDRPTFDPLIVHVGAPSSESAFRPWKYWNEYLESELEIVERDKYVHAIPLLTSLWPGPLTIVLPKTSRVPDLATAGLPTVAVRSPRHQVAQALLREVGQPLAAPSANRFGRISPTSAADVAAELGDRIGLILDGGQCEIGIESTVVRVDQETDIVALLRPGFYSREFLEERLGRRIPVPQPCDVSQSGAPQAAPGLLASHYAPAKPLLLLPAAVAELAAEQCASLAEQLAGRGRLGLLLYAERTTRATRDATAGPQWLTSASAIRVLSEHGDQTEAARNLFRLLRELDADPAVDVILAEPVPDESGLGYAIADRLRRAGRAWNV